MPDARTLMRTSCGPGSTVVTSSRSSSLSSPIALSTAALTRLPPRWREVTYVGPPLHEPDQNLFSFWGRPKLTALTSREQRVPRTSRHGLGNTFYFTFGRVRHQEDQLFVVIQLEYG